MDIVGPLAIAVLGVAGLLFGLALALNFRGLAEQLSQQDERRVSTIPGWLRGDPWLRTASGIRVWGVGASTVGAFLIGMILATSPIAIFGTLGALTVVLSAVFLAISIAAGAVMSLTYYRRRLPRPTS